MGTIHRLLYQIIFLSSCYLVAIVSLDCSVDIVSYSKSDTRQTGSLSLNSVANALDWSDRTTAGVVVFAVASDCTVSTSQDLTFINEADFLDKIVTFVQSQPLGTHIIGATLYEVLYDSIQVQNLFRALGVHMFGSFDGTLFEQYSTTKNDQLYSSTNNNAGTLLFITQKGSPHKALYKSTEGGQTSAVQLTATLTLDYTCVPFLPQASLFGGDQTTSDSNRRFSQQSSAITGCSGSTIKGWQYIPTMDNSAGPAVNLYLLNTATGAAIVDTEINTSGQSTSAKASMCLATANQQSVTDDIKYGLYYDDITDGESVIQALYPTFEGALNGQCGYDAAITDLNVLKALDTSSLFSNGGTDIFRSYALRPIFESEFVASCECSADADCQGSDGHMICESGQCMCETDYTYNQDSNTCQFTLEPLSISSVTTSGLAEGSVEELYDLDSNGDLDLTTSIALSPIADPWVVIDMGAETTLNSLDISVPEVQFGAAELTCCGSQTFLYTFDHPDVMSNTTCDISTSGNECTEIKITGPYAWLLYDTVDYDGSSILFENSDGSNVETHSFTFDALSIRRVDELGVLESTSSSTCLNVDGSDNVLLGACDMEVYFDSDLIRRKTDGLVLNPTTPTDGAALSFSASATTWKSQDIDSDANSGIDTDDLAAGAYLELQSDSTLCLGLQSGSSTALALRSKAENTDDCLQFKQKRTVPRLLAQQQEQFDITLDGDGDCTNDIKDFQNTYSYPACTVIEEQSGSTSTYVVYNSATEVGFAASDQELWANCDGSSTQRLLYKADNPSLHDFVVGVSSSFSGTYTASDFTTCATYSGTLSNGQTTTVQCDKPQKGRYIAISIPSKDTDEVIFLSGVKINGIKDLPVGEDCTTDLNCQSQGGGANFVCLSSSCACADGFVLDSSSAACIDADECSLTTDGCDQTCTNSRGSYTCSCNEHCTLNADQHQCDCPSCSQNNGGCVNGVCAESGTAGLVVCSCDIDGTTLDTDQKTCINVNECADSALHTCDEETFGIATCVDFTPASNGNPKYWCDCGDASLIAYNQGTATCEILSSVKTNGDTANSLCSVNNGGCSETCNPGADPLTFTCSCGTGGHLLPDGLTCVVCDPTMKAECDADVNSLAYCTDDPTDASADICVCQFTDLGISWDGAKCTTGTTPDNLCSIENGLCEHNCLTGTQTDSISSLLNISCSCTNGYQLQPDGLSPDNVCSGTDHGCDTTCNPGTNIQDFTCSCNSGFDLATDGKTCENVNECLDSATCATTGTPAPTCRDTPGSFTCDCGTGYTWDSDLCKNIDECAVNKGGCEQICQDNDGSFTCTCASGYTLNGDGFTCDDNNECDIDNGGCGDNTNCVNLPGSSECECVSSGYQFVSNSFTVCEDIIECDTNNGNCNQGCTNSVGSFTCTCESGYELSGDQLTCVNVDECAIGIDLCEHDCRDLEGSFICECQIGYEVDTANEKACRDIDECTTGQSDCSQICTNTIGSFQCSCNADFNLNTDGKTCTAQSACSGVTCERGQCSAIDGSYNCICDSGYELSTTETDTCIDINECDLNICRANSQCENTVGGFSCPCDVGFSALSAASQCDDIDECSIGNPCSAREVCTNTVGSYTCACSPQYRVNAAGQCTAATVSLNIVVVIQAPTAPSLPSTQTFNDEGAIPGTPANLLLVVMCQTMNARANFQVRCVVIAVSISSLATEFMVEFEDDPKTSAEVATLSDDYFNSLAENEDGKKVLTLGNETIPLNDTGTVLGITDYVTPDGRVIEDTIGIDSTGSSLTGGTSVCSFYIITAFCMNGSSCIENTKGLPECSCLEGFQGEQCSEIIEESTTTSGDKLSGTEIILISVFVPLFVIGVGIVLFWIIYMALRTPVTPQPQKYRYPGQQQSRRVPEIRNRPPQRSYWRDDYSTSTPEAVESETGQQRLSRWPAYRAYGLASRFQGAANYYGNGYFGNRY